MLANQAQSRYLMLKGLVTAQEIAGALPIARARGADICSILIEEGLIGPAQAQQVRLLAEQGRSPGAAAPSETRALPGREPSRSMRDTEALHPDGRRKTPQLVSADERRSTQLLDSDELPAAEELPRFGPYQLIRPLGRGGMGAVFRARHPDASQPVAIKILLPTCADPADGERLQGRFVREARALAKLSHPGVVSVKDAGQFGGRPYFTMRIVDGPSLAECQEELRSEDGLTTLRRLLAELCEALAACHEVGLIHRDLKPQNVLIDETGAAVLIDFGLVKLDRTGLAESRCEGESLTRTGESVGTPGIMAPEQGSGLVGIGPATDVWGLGATLFVCLTGRCPYEQESEAELLGALLSRDPPRLRSIDPDLPPWIDELCARCLNRRPEERPSLSEIRDALITGRVARSPGQKLRLRLLVGLLALAVILRITVPNPPRPGPRTQGLSADFQPPARRPGRRLGQLPSPKGKPQPGVEPTWNGRTARAWLNSLAANQVTLPATVEALVKLGPRALPYLRHRLGDPQLPVRRAVARALARYGAESAAALPELLRCLEDPDDEARPAQEAALAALGPKAVSALITILEQSRTASLARAIRLLGVMGEDATPAAAAIGTVLSRRRGSWELRYAAAELLGAMGVGADAAGPALAAGLSDPDGSVRFAALEALSRVRPRPRVVMPALLDLLGQAKGKTRHSCIQLLGAYGTRAEAAIPALIPLLQDPDLETRRHAESALGQIRSSRQPRPEPALPEELAPAPAIAPGSLESPRKKNSTSPARPSRSR